MSEQLPNVPQGGEQVPNPPVGGQQPEPPKGGEPQNPVNTPVKSPEEVQAEFLKSLGVNSVEDVQKAIKGFNEFQESQKTEAQKQQEQLQSLQEQLKSEQSEKATLSAKIEALSKGIRAEAVDDVIKLVQGTEDVGKAIEDVLKKYPHFGAGQQQQEQQKPSFGTPKYNEAQSTDKDKWLSAFKKFM